MFTSNPFAVLAASIPPGVMKTYVVAMILLVIGGTLLDIMHKKSATYFFENWRRTKGKGKPLSGGDMVSVAVQTAAVDVLTSAEFCNQKRRVAHLLTMYGFILYVVSTAVMVFSYSTPGAATPAIWPLLWWLGGLMVCVGGYWFWFFIRVDVASEGYPPFRFVQADLFIVSLVLSVTFGLIWALVQRGGGALSTIFLGLYLIATTILFVSIPWSKFSHMFFKPAAAMQKRIETANGTRRGLPAPADKPATFGSARRAPHHF
jgi:hypothetical protein